MRISVIMPVFLGYYEFSVHKSATNPHKKFVRAIDSFLDQTFKDAELVIISDGDLDAEKIYYWLYSQHKNIKFKLIEKQALYSGVVRQTGLGMAEGEIVCYLDADDIIGINHLQIISDNFDTGKYDWVYYDDFLIKNADHTDIAVRTVKPMRNVMGTSSFAHKRSVPVVWGENNTHDFDLIEKYLLHRPSIKIPTPQYYVCHCSGLKMDF